MKCGLCFVPMYVCWCVFVVLSFNGILDASSDTSPGVTKVEVLTGRRVKPMR